MDSQHVYKCDVPMEDISSPAFQLVMIPCQTLFKREVFSWILFLLQPLIEVDKVIWFFWALVPAPVTWESWTKCGGKGL